MVVYTLTLKYTTWQVESIFVNKGTLKIIKGFGMLDV
jgi:hypothetical protein